MKSLLNKLKTERLVTKILATITLIVLNLTTSQAVGADRDGLDPEENPVHVRCKSLSNDPSQYHTCLRTQCAAPYDGVAGAPANWAAYGYKNLEACIEQKYLPTLYEILDLPDTTATIPAIKKAYREASRKMHPDKAPVGTSEVNRKIITNMFTRINNAHVILTGGYKGTYDWRLGNYKIPSWEAGFAKRFTDNITGAAKDVASATGGGGGGGGGSSGGSDYDRQMAKLAEIAELLESTVLRVEFLISQRHNLKDAEAVFENQIKLVAEARQLNDILSTNPTFATSATRTMQNIVDLHRRSQRAIDDARSGPASAAPDTSGLDPRYVRLLEIARKLLQTPQAIHSLIFENNLAAAEDEFRRLTALIAEANGLDDLLTPTNRTLALIVAKIMKDLRDTQAMSRVMIEEARAAAGVGGATESKGGGDGASAAAGGMGVALDLKAAKRLFKEWDSSGKTNTDLLRQLRDGFGSGDDASEEMIMLYLSKLAIPVAQRSTITNHNKHVIIRKLTELIG